MKKLTFIILAVLLVLALGVGVYYKIKLAKLPIEKILPEGAVLYGRVSGIEKGLQEFKSTRLWWEMKNIDIELLLRKSGLPQEHIEQYEIFKSDFFRFAAELFLDKIFGQEIALAVYPAKIDFDPKEPKTMLNSITNLASNVILVTRLKPEAEFVEFLSKLLNKFNQKAQIIHEEYKGHRITTVKLGNELDFAYVQIRDLLAIGLGKKSATSCLDVVVQDKPSFSEDRNYLSAVSELPQSAQTVGYGNLEALFAEIRRLVKKTLSQSPEIPSEERVKILESFAKTEGFKTVGLASVSGKISEAKIVINVDKSQMDAAVAKAYSYKPQKNETFNFVPKDVIGYQWNNCLDMKLAWDNFQQQLAKRPKQVSGEQTPEQIIAEKEEDLGLSIEYDIIPALGNETGGFLSDINLEGPIPIPEILLFVKINDKATIESLINNLTKKNNLLFQSEEYKDRQIKYISLPFGQSLQPGYSFLNEYLLVSTRKEVLKKSIDVFNDESMSLLASGDFQDINFGLTEENNAVSFLKTDLLLGKMREISAWALNWLSLMATSLETFQRGAEQRLDSLKIDAQIEEQKLKELKANSQVLAEEIKSFQSQGLDASFKQQKLGNIEAKIKEKEERIGLLKQDIEKGEQELKDILQKSLVAKIDPALVKIYLNELVYPILDGLQANKATSSRSIFNEDMFILETFSKMEE